MNRSRTLTRVVLITAAISVGALGVAALIGLVTNGFNGNQIGRGGITVDDRKTGSLDGIELVAIETASEDVNILEGTGESLEARLHGTAGTDSPQNLPKLTVERSGSTLTVRLYPEKTFGLGLHWNNLVLDVSVPKGSAKKLSVKTASGNIHVTGESYAALVLTTASGDAAVETVTAPEFSMRTSSGTLSAVSVAATHAELSSVSGDIRIKALAGDSTLHSTSGTVNVAFTVVPSRIDASSTSGDVILKLPADGQFLLDADSTSGDVTCRFPITISKSATGGGRHALSGAVGGGSGQVAARTVSGNIRIEN
jgi:lia operon protein LiaG